MWAGVSSTAFSLSNEGKDINRVEAFCCYRSHCRALKKGKKNGSQEAMTQEWSRNMERYPPRSFPYCSRATYYTSFHDISWRSVCHRKRDIIHLVCSKPPLYAPFEHKALRTAHGLPYLTLQPCLIRQNNYTFHRHWFQITTFILCNLWKWSDFGPSCFRRIEALACL